jgi:XTP/dITP diphosphohydrolase
MRFESGKLVLATHNPGKVAEIRNLFRGRDIEIVAASDLNLVEPDETEDSFIGNATLKAKAACAATGLPALADDSGLSISALNGAPGVYSADWAMMDGGGRDFGRAMARVESELSGKTDRRARFTSVFVIAFPDGKTMAAEGHVDGEIVFPARGSHGFGYDPIFRPENETRTFGEMTLEEKKRYSHRTRAFEDLMAKYF